MIDKNNKMELCILKEIDFDESAYVEESVENYLIADSYIGVMYGEPNEDGSNMVYRLYVNYNLIDYTNEFVGKHDAFRLNNAVIEDLGFEINILSEALDNFTGHIAVVRTELDDIIITNTDDINIDLEALYEIMMGNNEDEDDVLEYVKELQIDGIKVLARSMITESVNWRRVI